MAVGTDVAVWHLSDLARLRAAARGGDVNKLAELLARRIMMTGPVTVAEYMATALGHPEHGYYTTRDPFGRAGDFITAPEISQIFGELIGLWFVTVWEQIGSPTKFNLVELGPGRGTLIVDALRAAMQVPAFLDGAELVLLETSRVLRASQAESLAAYDPVWCDSFDGVPDGPILAIGNEFFDALPVHQFVRTPRGWRERLIAWDETELRFIVSASATPHEVLLAPEVRETAPVGAIAEVQPQGLSIAAALGNRIEKAGGAVLIVDYGHGESAPGDSLQAVCEHEPVDVLDGPGEADLTVHVDFAALRRAVGDRVSVWGPVAQGTFLERLGIALRAEALTKHATPAQAADIALSVERLIAPNQMGSLFKVLSLTQAGLSQPPGFEE
jgi:NADH dehydrogenase [ubiquinone] 1 alpha subcomplex assembly factor 7